MQDKKIAKADQIIAEIDALEDIFLQCKSVFPAIGDNLIGQTSFETAPYYKWRGYSVSVHTGNPITEDFIKRYSKIGKWINENAIIRLHGILTYHGIMDKIDQKIDGWKQVDLMRRMRNVFTKTKLNYKPDDPENVRLRNELTDNFKLMGNQFPEGEIPTPVDKVIRPIFEGCRKYIRGKKHA
jgi:hypothetical protein